MEFPDFFPDLEENPVSPDFPPDSKSPDISNLVVWALHGLL